MTIGLLFWIIMLFLLFFGWRVGRVNLGTVGYWGFGFSGTIWVLLFLIGWKIFGFPIKG